MKKWKEFSREERRMIIIIGVLLVAILLSFGRVKEQFDKGIKFFFSKEQVEK